MARGQLDYSGLQYGVKSIGDAVQQGQKSQLEMMLKIKKQEQQARKNNMDVFKMWMDSEGKAIGNLLQKGKVEEATKKFEMAKQNPNLAPVFVGLGIDMLSFDKKGKDTAITVRMPMNQNMADQTGSTTPLGTPTKATFIRKSNGDIVFTDIVPLIKTREELIQDLMKEGFKYEDAEKQVDSFNKSLNIGNNGNANLGNNANNSDKDFESYLDKLEKRYGKPFDQAQINMARQKFNK